MACEASRTPGLPRRPFDRPGLRSRLFDGMTGGLRREQDSRLAWEPFDRPGLRSPACARMTGVTTFRRRGPNCVQAGGGWSRPPRPALAGWACRARPAQGSTGEDARPAETQVRSGVGTTPSGCGRAWGNSPAELAEPVRLMVRAAGVHPHSAATNATKESRPTVTPRDWPSARRDPGIRRDDASPALDQR